MKTRSVSLFFVKTILCAFLATFAISASAHYGCKYRHHTNYRGYRVVETVPCSEMTWNNCGRCHVRVVRTVPCNVYWNCGHYVPFDGYVPGRWVRLQ